MRSLRMHRVSGLAAAAMLASCLSLLPASSAVAGPREALAEVQVVGSLVSFQPQIPYRQVRVTVSGPEGFQIVESFGQNQVPAVALPGTDGLYKYELRFSPLFARDRRQRFDPERGLTAERGGDSATDKLTVQRGWFSLEAGSLVPDNLAEGTVSSAVISSGPVANVVLTNADGVIRNSLCVGFDCPNSPIFDDSTILMMENNTRIKFGDTSNAPFPNNDWEIEANSNLSGGANYLGFNDCGSADNDGGCATDLVFAVEAGVRQSALYVEDDGDVGIGTSNPILDLHIVTGNTPALRLDQDGSSGFTPQIWDVAGNETNFFIRDITAGSRLPLRIRPGAPSNSVFIAPGGELGLGTSAPAQEIHLRGSNPQVLFEDTTDSADFWVFGLNAAEDFIFNFQGAGTPELRISKTGSLVVNGTTMNVPDYVFEPDYPLMPLDELASFVAREKHLPGIPSAEQIGREGLSLNGMQMSLLRKVEELTLYLLALKEENSELRASLAEIQGRLAGE